MITSRIKEHANTIYFLCQYVQYHEHWKDKGVKHRAFEIIKPLKNPYIAEEIKVSGEYFVMKIERRFAITEHVPAATWSCEELELL